ncbi:mediator complex subunit 16-like [Arapaima gigas]
MQAVETTVETVVNHAGRSEQHFADLERSLSTMDVAYVCEWEKRPKSNHCPSIPLVCAWSCRNLIAFTTDLKNEEDEKELSHMIHIIDTEHPWDVYSINSGHTEVISCLEWDQSGSRLLSADGDGHIKCWTMADHLVNSWESSLGSAVEGDPIVALSWLHNGVKLALHVEKASQAEASGSTNFGEKFSRVKFSPSLTLFGGKPMEGWLAVTVSGLVTVSLLKPNGALLTASESLCRLRGRVALADIAFTGGGNIVVAATDGSSSSPVQFFKVCVSVVNEKCRIDTELLPSLFMRCTTDPVRRDKYPAVTHLKFLTRENSEQVLLCASSQTGSIVECWSLRKEGLPVNNIFQHRSPVVGEKQPMILKWRILSATNDLERVSAVALPKLPISISNTDLKVASDTKFCPGLGLALAFHDGSIQILHRLSLHMMGVYYGSAASGASQRVGDETAIKRQRTGGPTVHYKALQFSWTSLALVGVDNHGKLHMIRVSPSMGQMLDINTLLRHLLFLLEYCMVTGYDWWDVLLHVQPGMVHNLVEKLHEEYMRQNQALQQVSISQEKGSVCIYEQSTSSKVFCGGDSHSDPLIFGRSVACKVFVCFTDIDKVMINLKTEEFVLDASTLQSLQQLIQWVGDFVLYLLANLPNQGSVVRPGFGFLRDGASLGMLREMMVVIRIWGLLKPGCLPIYTATSDNQDSMSLLFRLLTKLWLCSRDEGHPQEPDEPLIDECCLLPSQLLVPTLDWLPINDGVICKLQSKHALRLQFGKPYSLPGLNSSPQVEIFSRTPGAQRMDHLRCLHMGVSPTEDCKACTRCGCVTMLRSPNKTTAVKQWEQRWIKNCLCGGLWRRIPSTTS